MNVQTSRFAKVWSKIEQIEVIFIRLKWVKIKLDKLAWKGLNSPFKFDLWKSFCDLQNITKNAAESRGEVFTAWTINSHSAWIDFRRLKSIPVLQE